MKNQDSPSQRAGARWSNRILIVSLIGIASLTLFPFQFISADRIALLGSPFLLGTSAKHVTASDVFLNVLLFVPIGFGLSAQRRKRGGSRWTTLLLTMVAGAIMSYTIELLQFYIPLRNSGWDDVVTNTIGSTVGFFFFELCGTFILEQLSKLEDVFEGWLSPGRIAALLLAYFAIWGAMSIPLQRQTRLSDWNPESVLVVGNAATGHYERQGPVFRLQIWNRALPEKLIEQMAASVPATDYKSSLLASYDFTAPPPFLDETKHLPALSSVYAASPKPSTSGSMAPWKDTDAAAPIELNGAWWLSTKVPVEALTREIQKTNQFTVRIVCAAEGFANMDERIVSLSRSADNVNFYLLQEGANLVLWFRNPLSERHSSLAWYVRDIFQAGQVRNVVASYDGSDAFLYVDGKSVPQSYRLSPGASLWHRFFLLQTMELEGCVLIYEMLIFLPAGLLIGMAARKWNMWKTAGKLLVVFGLFLPPVLLDLLLASISGRRIFPENIFVSALLGVAGVLLINADSLGRDERL